MSSTNQTFEQSLKRLEDIVNKLEQGDVPLETALDHFQEGIQLSKDLKKQLNDADKLLKKIVEDDGQEKPFELN